MTYLDELAAEIRRQVPADLLPSENTGTLFRIYALLALAKGTAVTAEDVHNAWSVWMHELNPGHRSIKPFKELDEATQASDEPYVNAIRAVAGQRAKPVDLKSRAR
jgi:hypothetical protein